MPSCTITILLRIMVLVDIMPVGRWAVKTYKWIWPESVSNAVPHVEPVCVMNYYSLLWHINYCYWSIFRVCCVCLAAMRALTPTSALNRVDVMIWNLWDMYWCTLIAAHCLGRVSRQRQRNRSMIASARKRCPRLSTSCAKATQRSLPCISTTAVDFDSMKPLTICTFDSCFEYCSARWTTTTTTCLTGPCFDKDHQLHPPSPAQGSEQQNFRRYDSLYP